MNEALNLIVGDQLEKTKQAVIDKQRAMGIRDRGESAGSLRVELASSDTSIRGQVFGFERLKLQDKPGRGPNRSGKPGRQQIENLKKWAVRHGMDEGAAWGIATKQAKEGTPVPNPHNPGGVLDPLDPAEVKKQLAPRIRGAVLKELRNNIFGS
jgi:hypothetical protein